MELEPKKADVVIHTIQAAPSGLFNADGSFNYELSAQLASDWSAANPDLQAEALKAYSELTPLVLAVNAKGYPTLADALLVLVKDLPNYGM